MVIMKNSLPKQNVGRLLIDCQQSNSQHALLTMRNNTAVALRTVPLKSKLPPSRETLIASRATRFASRATGIA